LATTLGNPRVFLYDDPDSVDEFQRAALLFVLGGLVTLSTLIMILRGHVHWRDRDPFDAG
jgi:hypothetical protein